MFKRTKLILCSSSPQQNHRRISPQSIPTNQRPEFSIRVVGPDGGQKMSSHGQMSSQGHKPLSAKLSPVSGVMNNTNQTGAQPSLQHRVTPINKEGIKKYIT